MTENESEVRVKDSRLFNSDGTIRRDAAPDTTAGETSSREPPPAAGRRGEEPPPAIDFPTFILSLASSVQISLGIIPNPITGKIEADLRHAKQTIDILGMLEEKTRGNLSPEESGLLRRVLFDVRMQYVELRKARK